MQIEKMHLKDKYSWIKHIDFIFIDVLAFIFSFLISYFNKFNIIVFWEKFVYRIIFILAILINVFLSVIINQNSNILRRSNFREIIKTLVFVFYNYIFLSVILYLFKLGESISREVVLVSYSIFFIFSYIFKLIWKKIIINKNINDYDKKNLIVVCKLDCAKTIIHNIENAETKNYKIVGLCLTDKNVNKTRIGNYEVVCKKNDLYKYISKHNIDEVFIGDKPSCISAKTIEMLLKDNVGINLSVNHIYGVEPSNSYSNKVGIYDSFGLGLYTFSSSQYLYILTKRIFDVICSIVGIVFLLVLMIIIKIANIVCKDSGPLFYSQTRIGKDGKQFKLYKFRSMSINADEILKEMLKDEKNKKEWIRHQKFDNDPRITKIGNFLRRTSLDEFPQFINVLKGDMSIVGPRPLIPGELELHGGIKLYEQVKPGITSWWACNGRSDINYDERLELEYFYVKNCSLVLDVVCIFKTIISVFKKSGAQ